MEYQGNLYGKVGNNYFPLLETTEDIENYKLRIKELEEKLSPKEYKNRLSKGLVNSLLKFKDSVMLHKCNCIHLRNDLSLTKCEYNNFSKIKSHNLVKMVADKSGYWELTKLGYDFCCNKIEVPDYVITLDNEVILKSEILVKIENIIYDMDSKYWDDLSDYRIPFEGTEEQLSIF